MTEFEIKHGLSQDEPGPLEPVELVAAVPAARTVAGWLPIESAPKDGTPLLLFARLVGVNIATNSPYAPTIHVGAYRTDLRIWTGSAYRNQLEIELEPTHWMPRPAFPDCAAPASPVSTVEQGNTAPLADVLEIARETGLRSFLHGVNAMDARTILQRFVDALPAPPAPAAGDAIRDLIAKHAELMEISDYAYFELARTRGTGWMAWLCSHPVETHPDRKVLARGQGETPDEACRAALAAIAAQRQGDA